jgi:hypothetical protein
VPEHLAHEQPLTHRHTDTKVIERLMHLVVALELLQPLAGRSVAAELRVMKLLLFVF